jgi:bifunctional UDP-N-acetylglucosamine pyrophosphorylase/glucosamine-1-phosphate N-acetyltransferase
MDNKFALEKFFDLSQISFSDIFDGVENIWEVIPKILTYVELKSNSNKPVIGKNTIIKDGVVFEGPCIIGDNCTIGPNAYFREGVIIGDNVRIGFSVEVKNSIIMNNSSVPHLNYVGDSIIGSHVFLGGGTLCANYRFDEKSITIKVDDKKYDTNLQKLGAIIGDYSKTAAGAVLNPGTFLEKQCIVFPQTKVFGYYKTKTTIK